MHVRSVLLIAGAIIMVGGPASAQMDRSSLPPGARPAPKPKDPATARPAPVPQQQRPAVVQPRPAPVTQPQVRPTQQRPQVVPPGPTQQRPQVVPPGPSQQRPQVLPTGPTQQRPQVLPPPSRPVNWVGTGWRHGTWQAANHYWYDDWTGYGRLMLYADPYFRGRGLYLRQSEPDLRRWRFNDRTQSLRVSGRWQVCSKTYYRGTCRVVGRPHRQLYNIGMDRRITSVRFLGYY